MNRNLVRGLAHPTNFLGITLACALALHFSAQRATAAV